MTQKIKISSTKHCCFFFSFTLNFYCRVFQEQSTSYSLTLLLNFFCKKNTPTKQQTNDDDDQDFLITNFTPSDVDVSFKVDEVNLNNM